MTTSQARAAIVKALRARGAKPRRGHLRLSVGDLFWYVDVRSGGVGPNAPLRLEVGCWMPALPPEPDGGAVDCPLLMEVPLGGDAVGETERVLDLVAGIGSLPTLRERLPELPGVLVDRALRDLL